MRLSQPLPDVARKFPLFGSDKGPIELVQHDVGGLRVPPRHVVQECAGRVIPAAYLGDGRSAPVDRTHRLNSSFLVYEGGT